MADDFAGQMNSPGGFAFGVQGWDWGQQRPTGITFFIDGTAMVQDQHGRPIRGFVDNDDSSKQTLCATCPPPAELRSADVAVIQAAGHQIPTADRRALDERKKYASHAQVVAALAKERIDWNKLVYAGWPQLPYEQLKEAKNLQVPPVEALEAIRDPKLRKDALRLYYEHRVEIQETKSQLEEEARQVHREARKQAGVAVEDDDEEDES